MTDIANTSSLAQIVNLRPVASTDKKTVLKSTDNVSSTPVPPADDGAITRHKQEREEIQAKRDALERQDPLLKAAEKLEALIPETELAPNTRLRINKDDESGRFVYQNIDSESGEVIKQFPPEQILEFLSYYRELEGLAVDDKV